MRKRDSKRLMRKRDSKRLMRKRDSKRRWIARFRCGRIIPWQVIVEYRISARLMPAKYLVNQDAIHRA